VGDAYSKFSEYIGDIILYASNLAFVVLMALGFAWLPKKLMLFVALVGVFGPMAVAWFGASVLGASASTVASVGPNIVQGLFALLAVAVTVSATNPGLAVLVLWLGAFLTSQVFQWLLDKAGLDLNNDGKVGWRDALIGLFSWMDRKGAKTCMTSLALDELTADMKKKQRAVRQNEEILDRVERLEAMLLAMGAPDLRDDQKHSPDDVIEKGKVKGHLNPNSREQRLPPPSGAKATTSNATSPGAASYTLLTDSEA